MILLKEICSSSFVASVWWINLTVWIMIQYLMRVQDVLNYFFYYYIKIWFYDSWMTWTLLKLHVQYSVELQAVPHEKWPLWKRDTKLTAVMVLRPVISWNKTLTDSWVAATQLGSETHYFQWLELCTNSLPICWRSMVCGKRTVPYICAANKNKEWARAGAHSTCNMQKMLAQHISCSNMCLRRPDQKWTNFNHTCKQAAVYRVYQKE